MPLHTIDPVFDGHSKILILGSFPSVASRSTGFYYGHERNRFWRVASFVTGETLPETVSEKKELLLNNGIALWDVIKSCDIKGSADSSIKDVQINDLSVILKAAKIKAVFLNGAAAKKLYDRFLLEKTGLYAHVLPSTSPANAAYSLERLEKIWSKSLSPFL